MDTWAMRDVLHKKSITWSMSIDVDGHSDFKFFLVYVLKTLVSLEISCTTEIILSIGLLWCKKKFQKVFPNFEHKDPSLFNKHKVHYMYIHSST